MTIEVSYEEASGQKRVVETGMIDFDQDGNAVFRRSPDGLQLRVSAEQLISIHPGKSQGGFL